MFQEWLEEVFIPGTQDVEKPLALFFDGHASHLSAKVVELAMDSQIDLVCRCRGIQKYEIKVERNSH